MVLKLWRGPPWWGIESLDGGSGWPGIKYGVKLCWMNMICVGGSKQTRVCWCYRADFYFSKIQQILRLLGFSWSSPGFLLGSKFYRMSLFLIEFMLFCYDNRFWHCTACISPITVSLISPPVRQYSYTKCRFLASAWELLTPRPPLRVRDEDRSIWH